MEQTRILIVEDDQTIAMGLEFALTQEDMPFRCTLVLKTPATRFPINRFNWPFWISIFQMATGFPSARKLKHIRPPRPSFF